MSPCQRDMPLSEFALLLRRKIKSNLLSHRRPLQNQNRSRSVTHSTKPKSSPEFLLILCRWALPAGGRDSMEGGSITLEEATKEDDSHLDSLNPEQLVHYKKILYKFLTEPWEAICMHRTCNCEPPLPVKQSISWDRGSRGCRILKCAEPKGVGCGFVTFVDSPSEGGNPAAMNFLYGRLQKAIAANLILRSNLKLIGNIATSSTLDNVEEAAADP